MVWDLRAPQRTQLRQERAWLALSSSVICPAVDYGGPDECEIWYMQLAVVTAYLTGTLSVLMLQL